MQGYEGEKGLKGRKGTNAFALRLDVGLLSPPSFGGVLSPLCYESGKAERGVVEKNTVISYL